MSILAFFREKSIHPFSFLIKKLSQSPLFAIDNRQSPTLTMKFDRFATQALAILALSQVSFNRREFDIQ
jgi:hypothetical protein